jgi:glycine/D-amino acid oxidase-like deaminating enzyme
MATQSAPKQHGVKGVYYGGEWLDIEDCPGTFVPAKCSGCDYQEACPRSRSRNVATTTVADDNLTYDIGIIGAGCIGAAIARELSKYQARIIWIEAADDVSQGATKGNSGIVHAGFDDKPGSVRAAHCWSGNQMFPQLDQELRFGYQKNGSLVLALNEKEVEVLHELMERGKTNGVKNLRIVRQSELRQMEPHANAIAALYSPDAGNVIPYEFCIALAENAVDNGVELRIRAVVSKIDYKKENDTFTLSMDHWEPHEYIRATTRGSNHSIQFACLLVAFLISGYYAALRMGGTTTTTTNLEIFLPPLTVMALLGVAQWFGQSSPQAPTKNTPLENIIKNAKKPEGTGGKRVEVAEMLVGGSGSHKQQGQVIHQSKVQCKYVINCAGGASDQIAKLIGDESFKIMPRLGDYLLLNRNQVRSTRWNVSNRFVY